jgi:hypothetical protein
MLDRKVISREYYRTEMTSRMGYRFPKGMEEAVIAEEKKLAEARQFMSPENGEGFNGQGNRSNNRNRPNESGGTEANDEARD